MSSTLKLITSIVNYIHDILVLLTQRLGLNLNDKQLHFIVIGFSGMVLFILVHKLFKYLVWHSLMAISFIYTFTVLVVLVFAIEIEQKITGRGHMDFQDIVEGLWGFLVAFALYIGFVIAARWLKKFFGHRRGSRK